MGISFAPQWGDTPPPHEDGIFRAAGWSRSVGSPDFWESAEAGVLFLFHLHGFEPLAEYAAGPKSPQGDAFWAKLVGSWLEEFGRPRMPAWHPYPTSKRILAWSAALSTDIGWPAKLRVAVTSETFREARYLN